MLCSRPLWLPVRSSASAPGVLRPPYACYPTLPEGNGESADGPQNLPFHAQLEGGIAAVENAPSVPSGLMLRYPAACFRRYSRGDIPIAWVKARVKCQGYW